MRSGAEPGRRARETSRVWPVPALGRAPASRATLPAEPSIPQGGHHETPADGLDRVVAARASHCVRRGRTTRAHASGGAGLWRPAGRPSGPGTRGRLWRGTGWPCGPGTRCGLRCASRRRLRCRAGWTPGPGVHGRIRPWRRLWCCAPCGGWRVRPWGGLRRGSGRRLRRTARRSSRAGPRGWLRSRSGRWLWRGPGQRLRCPGGRWPRLWSGWRLRWWHRCPPQPGSRRRLWRWPRRWLRCAGWRLRWSAGWVRRREEEPHGADDGAHEEDDGWV